MQVFTWGNSWQAGPWASAHRRHRVAISFGKTVGEACLAEASASSPGSFQRRQGGCPHGRGRPPGVSEGELERSPWSGAAVGAQTARTLSPADCDLRQSAERMGRAAPRCVQPPGWKHMKRPGHGSAHRMLCNAGAHRAALGLGPGRQGCQGPILGAVRTHYPHLRSGTMASPVVTPVPRR